MKTFDASNLAPEVVAAAIIVAGEKYGGRVGEADEQCAVRIMNFACDLINEIEKRRVKRGPGRPPTKAVAETE